VDEPQFSRFSSVPKSSFAYLNCCLKKTASELLLLCKAFLAALRSALTAQPGRCE